MTVYKVWDPFIRIFHWSLVAGFAANALIVDDDSKLHEWIGYAVLGLVVLRVVWGLIGPATARFASFAPAWGDVTGQLTEIATHRRHAHLGHSPLGALMVFNLLATMIAIGVTGHMMTTTAFWGAEWVEEAHEVLVTWAELSIVLHVAGVIWESRRTGVNLARAMFSGRKSVPEDVRLSP